MGIGTLRRHYPDEAPAPAAEAPSRPVSKMRKPALQELARELGIDPDQTVRELRAAIYEAQDEQAGDGDEGNGQDEDEDGESAESEG